MINVCILIKNAIILHGLGWKTGLSCVKVAIVFVIVTCDCNS